MSAEWADVSLIVENAAASVDERTFTQRLASARRNFAYAVYTRLDERLKAPKCEPYAFQPKNYEALTKDVPRLQVTPRQTKFSDYIEDADLEKIRDANLDVLLRCGFRILRGDILSAAKYGIWSYHHGDSRVNRGSLPGFWEVMRGDTTTGAVLQVLSENLDDGMIVDRYLGATERLSVTANQHNLYWKSSSMLLNNLRQLYADPDAFLESRQPTKSPQPYCHPMRSWPTNTRVVSGLAKMAGHYVGKKAKHVFHYDQWLLAYHLCKKEGESNESFYQYKKIMPPKERFWADPFIIERDDTYYVFFEEYFYATDRAHISVLEIDQKGKWSKPRRILQRPYHLSYPFVFEYEGDVFMIPETGENETIEMYRCTEFPDKWELDTELFTDIDAADTTLYQQDGTWWMFTSIVEKGLLNRDSCFLFSADNPRGPWKPHPQNPIKRDVTNSRMAGNLFTRDGKLYRPAQDCAERYGVGMKINEIVELNEQRYEEKVVAEITPDWDPLVIGTHSINQVGRLTVIDLEMLRSRIF